MRLESGLSDERLFREMDESATYDLTQTATDYNGTHALKDGPHSVREEAHHRVTSSLPLSIVDIKASTGSSNVKGQSYL